MNFPRLAIEAVPKAATAGNAEEAGAIAQRRKARPAFRQGTAKIKKTLTAKMNYGTLLQTTK